ncbi:MAG: hypothetical protein AAB967_03045 [Patescibacteria group bacterium]
MRRLDTPKKVQDFLDTLPINFEKKGETCMSPRMVLRERKAHCMEGAMCAASAFWLHGERPLLLDLKTADPDVDHVVAPFRAHGCWGAVSKTNHAVLRYREPVYKTIRELALSYFHEYFLDNGKKTMRSFSRPFDLRKFRRRGWTTSEKDLWYISDALDESPHEQILSRAAQKGLRRADPVEIKAGKLTEWKKER